MHSGPATQPWFTDLMCIKLPSYFTIKRDSYIDLLVSLLILMSPDVQVHMTGRARCAMHLYSRYDSPHEPPLITEYWYSGTRKSVVTILMTVLSEQCTRANYKWLTRSLQVPAVYVSMLMWYKSFKRLSLSLPLYPTLLLFQSILIFSESKMQ